MASMRELLAGIAQGEPLAALQARILLKLGLVCWRRGAWQLTEEGQRRLDVLSRVGR